jgi:hypothetical protein
MKRTWSALLMLAVAILASGQGKMQDHKYSAKVKLTVEASPEIRDEFVSFIGRELRSLQDVEIVDDGADFELKIIAMTMHSQGSSATSGIAISTIVLRSVRRSPIGYFASECANEKGFSKAVDAVMASDGILEDSNLLVGPPGELRSLSAKVVADFDQNTLEPMRKLVRQTKPKN